MKSYEIFKPKKKKEPGPDSQTVLFAACGVGALVGLALIVYFIRERVRKLSAEGGYKAVN